MKGITLLIVCIVVAFFAKSQNVVQWNFNSKKIAERTYEVHMTPTVKSPWHIYSQTRPDDGALPTNISFNKNHLVIIEWKTKEAGKIVSKYEKVFEVESKR